MKTTAMMDLELELATTIKMKRTTTTTSPSPFTLTKWNNNAQLQRKQKHNHQKQQQQKSNRFFSFTCQPSATQTLLIFFNMLIPVMLMASGNAGIGMASAMPVEEIVETTPIVETFESFAVGGGGAAAAAATGTNAVVVVDNDDVGVVESSLVPAANLSANATIPAIPIETTTTPKPTETTLLATDTETLDQAGFKTLLNEDLETGIRNAVKSEIESAEEAAEKPKTDLQSLLPEGLEEGIREEVKSEIKTDEELAENNRSAIKRQIEEEEEKEKEKQNLKNEKLEENKEKLLEEKKTSAVTEDKEHGQEEHHTEDKERSTNAISAHQKNDESSVVVAEGNIASNQIKNEQIVEDEEEPDSANELDSNTKDVNDAHEVGLEAPKEAEASLVSSESVDKISDKEDANLDTKESREIISNESHYPHHTEEVQHSQNHESRDNESEPHVTEEEDQAKEITDKTHGHSKSNALPKESNAVLTVEEVESSTESKIEEEALPETHTEVTPSSTSSPVVSSDAEIKTDNGLLSVVLNENFAPTEETPNGKTSLYTIEQEMEEAEKHETTFAPELEQEEDKHLVIKKQGVETEKEEEKEKEKESDQDPSVPIDVVHSVNVKETQTDPVITVELPDELEEEHDFVPKTGEDKTAQETEESGQTNDDVNSYVSVKEDTASKKIEGTVINEDSSSSEEEEEEEEVHLRSHSTSTLIDSDENSDISSSPTSKGSRSILHKHHDEAATAHESISPLNADRTMHDTQADEDATLGIGKALPTVSRGQHNAKSQRSSVIIALCSGVAIMFIVFSLVIFMISHQRQHGTLDIEMQEQRCGKDNLDEEDAQLKLLEIELPTQNALVGSEETDECL